MRAIRPGASVNATGGDVSLGAASTSASTVQALPGVTTGGSSFGLGISFALSIVNDNTFAGIDDGGMPTNAGNLTLHANGQHAMVTEARTGASGGGVTIVPSIAIALSNVTSRATIGVGGPLAVAGALDAKAELTASAITSASGSATTSGSAAIGVSLALTIANHTAEATTFRNITATGAVSFQALGSSRRRPTPRHRPPARRRRADSGAPAGGVDGQVTQQRNHADSVAGPGQGSGGTASPSASTSSGAISVAAAVGVNISNSRSRAYIPTTITVTAGGLLTFALVGEHRREGEGRRQRGHDQRRRHDRRGRRGQPRERRQRGRRRDRAVVVSHGLAADAAMTNVGGDLTHRFAAESKSGAGGGDVGISGSVSINIVNVATSGAIRTGGSVDATGGNVTLGAASTSVSTVSALPAGVTGGSSFGLGISFALSIINDHTYAGIDDGGALINAADLTLHANGQHALTTTAETGASGGVAIVPSIAVAISNVSSAATIGTSLTTLTLTGALDAKAELTASAITSATGSANSRRRRDRYLARAHDREPHRRLDDAAQRVGGWRGQLPGARVVRVGREREGLGPGCARGRRRLVHRSEP